MNPSLLPGHRPHHGFTLTEVALALGIVSFALVALLGLLAVGFRSGRESSEEVQAANLANRILEERRAAPTATTGPAANFALPALNASSAATGLFLSQEGAVVPASSASKIYRMSYNITYNASGVSQVYLILSSPFAVTDISKMNLRHEVLTSIAMP